MIEEVCYGEEGTARPNVIGRRLVAPVAADISLADDVWMFQLDEADQLQDLGLG